MSGTYQKIDQMGNYVLNANLNAGISSYIDTQAGTAKVTSAVSGTYQTISGMSNYATTQSVASIQQTVSQQGASIALVVGSGRVVDGSGNVNGSIVISAINGVGSQALINFDKINITGVTTFLKASDVGAGGQTVIDGGRITTGANIGRKNIKSNRYIIYPFVIFNGGTKHFGNRSFVYIRQL